MFIRLSLNLLDNILIDPTNSKKFNGNTILFKKKKNLSSLHQFPF